MSYRDGFPGSPTPKAKQIALLASGKRHQRPHGDHGDPDPPLHATELRTALGEFDPLQIIEEDTDWKGSGHRDTSAVFGLIAHRRP